MSNLALKIEEYEPQATKVWFEDDSICLLLADGRKIFTPVSLYPSLLKASPSERTFELFGDGTSIYFESLDLYLSVQGIILGVPEQEFANIGETVPLRNQQGRKKN